MQLQIDLSSGIQLPDNRDVLGAMLDVNHIIMFFCQFGSYLATIIGEQPGRSGQRRRHLNQLRPLVPQIEKQPIGQGGWQKPEPDTSMPETSSGIVSIL